MTTKSVSGTCLTIALGAVLAWPWWGWAGQVIGPLPAVEGTHPENVGKCFESVDGPPGKWMTSKEVPCPSESQPPRLSDTKDGYTMQWCLDRGSECMTWDSVKKDYVPIKKAPSCEQRMREAVSKLHDVMDAPGRSKLQVRGVVMSDEKWAEFDKLYKECASDATH